MVHTRPPVEKGHWDRILSFREERNEMDVVFLVVIVVVHNLHHEVGKRIDMALTGQPVSKSAMLT
jgi:hypothetical protein